VFRLQESLLPRIPSDQEKDAEYLSPLLSSEIYFEKTPKEKEDARAHVAAYLSINKKKKKTYPRRPEASTSAPSRATSGPPG